MPGLGGPPGQCYCVKIIKGQSLVLPQLALQKVPRPCMRSCVPAAVTVIQCLHHLLFLLLWNKRQKKKKPNKHFSDFLFKINILSISFRVYNSGMPLSRTVQTSAWENQKDHFNFLYMSLDGRRENIFTSNDKKGRWFNHMDQPYPNSSQPLPMTYFIPEEKPSCPLFSKR